MEKKKVRKNLTKQKQNKIREKQQKQNLFFSNKTVKINEFGKMGQRDETN